VEGRITMTRSTDSRSTSTREAKPRRTFEEPNWLDIPPTAIERFRNEGMSLRWIRMTIKGNDDIQNMSKRQAEGWEIVQSEEVPEMTHSSVVREEGRYSGAVCRGDLALAKMPSDLAESRQEYYEQKSREAVGAVNAQLMRNSDSRMPISNTSRSRVTTGKQPSFQE
jgi:hypothetical protein|tara:strand:- start:833 stop:1333 length:501 start_codon:yes stop_codon:yes gene_type:complete